MKVVGLSGAQGGGKSTLLIELEKRGWLLDKFRVSRAVQAQLGWEKLDTVMESWDTMVKFQEEVFRQKYKHDSELVQQPGARTIDSKGHLILTERTFADILAYTTLWTWKHVDRGSVTVDEAMIWLRSYRMQCNAAQKMYDGTLLLPYMDVVKWEEDPNRAARNDVDKVFEDVQRFLEQPTLLTAKRFTITAESVQDRADQVETFLRTL